MHRLVQLDNVLGGIRLETLFGNLVALDMLQWLTSEFYSRKMKPLLAQLSNSVIASAIGVSRWYGGRIRKGYHPHPRHWPSLAHLVGIHRRVDSKAVGTNFEKN